MLLIAAWRMWFGVTKSGWPTPREMTPSMLARRSKKRRMPEDGIACTCWEMLPRWVTGSLIAVPRVADALPPPLDPRLRAIGRPDAGPEMEFGDIVQEHVRAVRQPDAKADSL